MSRIHAASPGLRTVLFGVVLPAGLGGLGLILSSQAPRGSAQFYEATFFTAAVYAAAWAAFGRHRRSALERPAAPAPARPGRELGRGLLIGLGLLALFLVGALVVRHLPVLKGPVDDLLENARYGPVVLTLMTTAINGVAEEMFFRRTVPAALPGSARRAEVVSVLLYLVVTACMGVPLLVLAALMLGTVAQYEARRSQQLWSPVALHLTWSLGMLLILPPLFLG